MNKFGFTYLAGDQLPPPIPPGACWPVPQGSADPFSLKTLHWRVFQAFEPLKTLRWRVFQAFEPLKTVHWTVFRALEPPLTDFACTKGAGRKICKEAFFTKRLAPVAALGRGFRLRLALRAALAGSVRFADATGRQTSRREK